MAKSIASPAVSGEPSPADSRRSGAIRDGADGHEHFVVALAAVGAATPALGVPEPIDQVGTGDAEGVGHPIHWEPPGGGDGKRNDGCLGRA